VNEEELLQQVRDYLSKYQSTDRSGYDQNQQKVWTDSGGLLQAIQSHMNSSVQPQQTNMWDQNARTLQDLMQQRQRKIWM